MQAVSLHQTNRTEMVSLYSRFEGVYDLRSGVELGVEALLRGRCGPRSLSPALLLGDQSPLGAPSHVDQLARQLHLRSHADRGARRTALFLNVLPETALADAADCRVFEQLLLRHQIAPSEVVVEISEKPCAWQSQLRRAIDGYRALGCRVALDDFGAEGQVDARLAEFSPDILKLDRHWLLAAGRPARWLRREIERAAGDGVQICAEGIESAAHLQRAMELGATVGQGFGLARLMAPGRLAA